MAENQGKYRLFTRSDFDGLVCAVLLKEKGMIDDIKFVHPKDMQDGKVEITPRDITTNLPYVKGVHLSFDHHSSEVLRAGGQCPDNLIIAPDAPSAARVVYDHFGGRKSFPSIALDMMADSALPAALFGLIALGLALTAVWLFGAKARHGDAPTLSLHPRQMGRALVVWAALVVSALVIEPLGFLLAGEVLVLLVMVIERMRSIPLIVTLLLVPPAMYVLFDTLLEVQLPGGTLWY